MSMDVGDGGKRGGKKRSHDGDVFVAGSSGPLERPGCLDEVGVVVWGC